MELYLLMAQRKCSYPGQYAPEVLACMGSEHHENPEYLTKIRQDSINSGEFDAVEIIVLNVDIKEIYKRLLPQSDPVSAICI